MDCVISLSLSLPPSHLSVWLPLHLSHQRIITPPTLYLPPPRPSAPPGPGAVQRVQPEAGPAALLPGAAAQRAAQEPPAQQQHRGGAGAAVVPGPQPQGQHAVHPEPVQHRGQARRPHRYRAVGRALVLQHYLSTASIERIP